jgi:calcium-dependent protein kinase
MSNKEQFTEEEARKLFMQALSAINYIHSQNVSHRDIKAENFVFTSVKSDTIKLIDFGLSSSFISVNESRSKPNVLRMRTLVGTKVYVAPEVFNREYTEKCDIWSAGIFSHNF